MSCVAAAVQTWAVQAAFDVHHAAQPSRACLQVGQCTMVQGVMQANLRLQDQLSAAQLSLDTASTVRLRLLWDTTTAHTVAKANDEA